MTVELETDGAEEYEYKRYRDRREVFQCAESTLIDDFYEALTKKLIALGIADTAIKPVRHNASYHQDEKIVADVMSLGIDQEKALALVQECKLVAKVALAEEIVDKGFPIEVVDSVVQYIAVVQQLAHHREANDNDADGSVDHDYHYLWVREQMFQLGAAGDNCPPEYLASVLEATCFMMVHHPEPMSDIFHIYKRYHQEGRGHIDIHATIDDLIRRGSQPNQIRAILNLHKHYGKELGSAFLALVKNAPKLMSYNGGVLQLAADFADLQLEPVVQEGVINQADKEIEYRGGALQLAVDLAARHIPQSLQVAMVKDAYHLQDYPGGLLIFAQDVHAGGFSEEANAGLIRKLINMSAIKRDNIRLYIKGLAKLREINPECIDDYFMTGYSNSDRYYTMVVEEDEKLVSLTADTIAAKIPHLSPKERNHLFAQVLALSGFPLYAEYREVAFLLAARAAHWKGFQFENSIDQLVSLVCGFKQFSNDQPPKGTLPTASVIADDLVTIAESDQANIKGRWYYQALYQGADREDIMTVVKVPFSSNWDDRDHTFRPSFEVIAERFLGEDSNERAKLAPIVGIILREAFHYYLGIGFGNEPQPMGVICRYVFGRGPEEEGGINVADIKQCEAILAVRERIPENFAECLVLTDKVSRTFSAYGDKLRECLRLALVAQFRDLGGYSLAPETPVEWPFDYLQRYPDGRLSNEAQVLSSPCVGAKLPIDQINEFATIAARLSQQYPTQAARFEEFLLRLLLRGPAQRPVLGATRVLKSLPEVVQGAGELARFPQPTLAEVLDLTRQLETPKVYAGPGSLAILAPPKLTRLSALAVANRVGGTAGRMLQILGECIPGPNGGELALDDDLASVWLKILETRIARPGFPPVGAKLHVDKAVGTNLVDQVIRQLNLGSTTFRTIHASKSLLMPIGQPIEIKLLLGYLKSKGLFDGRNFDMQVCMGGRLKARRHEASIGVLNASMLLATQATPSYAVDAWSTPDHNKLTNAYIMAYGDKVRYPAYYDLATKDDRTDMLGRRDLGDLDLYQTIATLLMHFEDGGYFEEIGKLFLERIVAILQRYKLYDALFECPWVFEPGVTSRTADTTTHRHWQMVEKFTAMRIVSEDVEGKGITGEVRRIIHDANVQAEKRFPDIIAQDPDQFVKLCTL